jgi:hypothetical protein
MQETLEPVDDNDLETKLRQLRPTPPRESAADLWYSAGFQAAHRRAVRWHAVAIIALSTLAVFAFHRPVPGESIRFVDRVATRQSPAEPDPPLPSLAGAIENRQLMEAALQDRWSVSSVGVHAPSDPPMRVWMSDIDVDKVGGLQ